MRERLRLINLINLAHFGTTGSTSNTVSAKAAYTGANASIANQPVVLLGLEFVSRSSTDVPSRENNLLSRNFGARYTYNAKGSAIFERTIYSCNNVVQSRLWRLKGLIKKFPDTLWTRYRWLIQNAETFQSEISSPPNSAITSLRIPKISFCFEQRVAIARGIHHPSARYNLIKLVNGFVRNSNCRKKKRNR